MNRSMVENREKKIRKMLSAGRTLREIGAALGISHETTRQIAKSLEIVPPRSWQSVRARIPQRLVALDVKIPNPKRYVWRPGGKTRTSLQKGATTRAASLAYGEVGMADGAPRLLTSNLDRLTRPKLQRWRIAAPQKFDSVARSSKRQE